MDEPKNMDIKELYCATLDDIKTKLDDSTAVGLVQASVLVKRMLLDNPRLYDEANRDYDVRLVFEIIDEWNGSMAMLLRRSGYSMFTVLNSIDPETNTSSAARVSKLARGPFFNCNVALIHAEAVSIHDIIVHAALALGGIQSIEAKSYLEKKRSVTTAGRSLHRYGPLTMIQIGKGSITTKQVRPVLNVIYKALSPLAAKIREN